MGSTDLVTPFAKTVVFKSVPTFAEGTVNFDDGFHCDFQKSEVRCLHVDVGARLTIAHKGIKRHTIFTASFVAMSQMMCDHTLVQELVCAKVAHSGPTLVGGTFRQLANHATFVATTSAYLHVGITINSFESSRHVLQLL
eukprot:m.88061 g.88061  ORF g.88061 m.88061 type:complete len:140 (-) comp8799_c2_seq2:1106-1525(-)